ncbi:MAG: hypothetical protein AAF546_05170 [Verrucomicrobiota bacterium]
MKYPASLRLRFICFGCQTGTDSTITKENAARDFEDGKYQILKFIFSAFHTTENEQRITDKYEIVFGAIEGDVIRIKLNLMKVMAG